MCVWLAILGGKSFNLWMDFYTHIKSEACFAVNVSFQTKALKLRICIDHTSTKKTKSYEIVGVEGSLEWSI